MKQRKSLLVAVALLALIGLQACDKFTDISYRTLAVSGIIFDTSMKTAAEAYKEGVIDNATADKIVTYGNIYYKSYQAAREALEAYYRATEGGSIGDKSKAIGCIVDMVKDLKAVTAAVDAATKTSSVVNNTIPLADEVKKVLADNTIKTTTTIQ